MPDPIKALPTERRVRKVTGLKGLARRRPHDSGTAGVERMKVIRRLLGQVLVLLALFVSPAGYAESGDTPVAGARWACWYDPDDLVLACLLSRAPSRDIEARASAVEQTVDQRLPTLVRTIWGNPEKLARSRISIPLWNVPYEMDFVRQLADSVMCGSRDDCSVFFDANADGRAPVRAAALRAGVSEVAVLAEMAAQGLQLKSFDTVVVDEPQRRSPRRRASLNG